MAFDWKSIVKTIAPVIGTALAGPLAGTAIKVLGDAIIGIDPAIPHNEDTVSAAVLAGITPEGILAMKKADQDLEIRLKELNIDIMRLQSMERLAYVADTDAARRANAGNYGVFWLGVTILGIFATATGLVLWGALSMLSGGIAIKDPSAIAALFGLVGTVLGYIAANAQQVVGFFFGSSQGSKDHAEAFQAAVTNFVATKK